MFIFFDYLIAIGALLIFISCLSSKGSKSIFVNLVLLVMLLKFWSEGYHFLAGTSIGSLLFLPLFVKKTDFHCLSDQEKIRIFFIGGLTGLSLIFLYFLSGYNVTDPEIDSMLSIEPIVIFIFALSLTARRLRG